ncbi:conserved exported hypothetical protein [Enterobacterales bacterium 8AC]|nr:conserved exported hypothetical protein [Enterobacterales bacterium 8AC]
MKKLAIITALVASNALFATSAFAESFAVSVDGTVTDTTCAASVDKTSVAMPSVNKNAFATVGKEVIGDDFTVSISACPAGTTKAVIAIKGTPDSDNTALFTTRHNAGDADGFGIKVKAGNNVVSPNGTTEYTLANGAVTAPYYVDYVSTKALGNLKSGVIKSTLNVDVSYQ